MAPGDVWTWTTHRGFVAVFHPDYADGKMFVTEAISGTTNEDQVDRVSVGTARRNGVAGYSSTALTSKSVSTE
jgi:hypothetical protein